MSTKLKSIKSVFGEVDITRFYGGDERGVSLQLTQDSGYIQVTYIEIELLIRALRDAQTQRISK